MMIQAVLGNPHHPEYGVATIPFPIPRDQYAHCITQPLQRLYNFDCVISRRNVFPTQRAEFANSYACTQRQQDTKSALMITPSDLLNTSLFSEQINELTDSEK